MITVDQIRTMLQQVILADISFDQFDERLSRASWDMHLDSSAEAISLVGKIELILAGFEDGLHSEDQTMSSLRELTPVLVVVNSNGALLSTSESGNVVSHQST